ncbi:MAG: S1-like domain-containing RNA-binding protein [Bacteroides sp.]|nr:S1-like domain-containing RNA-binding protein [Bacteroides sp.]MCM1378681.1 S1-like domain-containing RNA-binding protein [Bacteroides sp.]MCM1444954.1 S1-like domain-containing RNA-binding protein [Prevotella sp.]
MIKIGQYNKLKVSHLTDFGAYLDAGNGVEILIPARYLTTPPAEGDELEVFVYNDSEDRLIATTEKPFIQVGQFAYLQVVDIHNRVGAFLDWGIPGKDLLCPFNEQRGKMTVGGIYCVYAYLDDTTKRIVASSKIEKFLGNVYPEYRPHQIVKALVCKRTDIGYMAIVNNLHAGMIYVDELITHPEIGETVTAYVKKVREDGKIDLTLKDTNSKRAHNVAEQIIELMEQNGGVTGITDKSSPEEIARVFDCSKKDFKKAVGLLYKERKIEILPGELRLAGK